MHTHGLGSETATAEECLSKQKARPADRSEPAAAGRAHVSQLSLVQRIPRDKLYYRQLFAWFLATNPTDRKDLFQV